MLTKKEETSSGGSEHLQGGKIGTGEPAEGAQPEVEQAQLYEEEAVKADGDEEEVDCAD